MLFICWQQRYKQRAEGGVTASRVPQLRDRKISFTFTLLMCTDVSRYVMPGDKDFLTCLWGHVTVMCCDFLPYPAVDDIAACPGVSRHREPASNPLTICPSLLGLCLCIANMTTSEYLIRRSFVRLSESNLSTNLIKYVKNAHLAILMSHFDWWSQKIFWYHIQLWLWVFLGGGKGDFNFNECYCIQEIQENISPIPTRDPIPVNPVPPFRVS